MYKKAKERMESQTYEAHTKEEIIDIINTNPGFVKADWCGSKECEEELKDLRGIKSRCILEDREAIDEKCVCCGKKAKYHVVWGIQY